MTTRLSWLAASSLLRGTRFGIVASLAGIQNSPTISIRIVATNSHHSVPTSGMVQNSTNRSTSP